MILKRYAKFEEKSRKIVVSKMTLVLIRALKVLKISTLIDLFRVKYITFDIKIYRGVIFHDTEESCKI